MMNRVNQNDLANTEYRIRYLEIIIDDAMATITRHKCQTCFNLLKEIIQGFQLRKVAYVVRR